MYGEQYGVYAQGFQSKLVTISYLIMLMVTLVKIITFWPVMNLSQSPIFENLTLTSKHFENPVCILMLRCSQD